ncbi:hypothetical protein [Listeria booriae]|nr:hypothetical protein [Listeria booriae]
MTFSEGVKFPKGWLLKLDPEAPNVTPYSANKTLSPITILRKKRS